MYKMNIVKSEKVLAAAAVQNVDADQWHRRLGHINVKKAEIQKSNCEICCESKQSRLPFPSAYHRSEQLLNLVHSDLCGPMEAKSIGQARYFLCAEEGIFFL